MKKKKVLLLLAEGFETYEASVFIDVIGWNLEEGDRTTELYTCGLRKEIKSSFDQKFIVDYTVNEINVDDFDALAIPGGFEIYNFYVDAYNEQLLKLVSEFKKKNKIIASVCVASLILGKSGVLNGKKGTIYNNPVRREALKACNVTVLDEPIVFDDNMITSWNPSTAIGVALLLLELITSKENADYIRNLMGFD